jgi:hypothetical protein
MHLRSSTPHVIRLPCLERSTVSIQPILAIQPTLTTNKPSTYTYSLSRRTSLGAQNTLLHPYLYHVPAGM